MGLLPGGINPAEGVLRARHCCREGGVSDVRDELANRRR